MSLSQDLRNAWDMRDRAEFERLLGKIPAAIVVTTEPSGGFNDCMVCGTPRAKHGTYPTCASHPYTADNRCQYILGAQCPGSACINGCVNAKAAA